MPNNGFTAPAIYNSPLQIAMVVFIVAATCYDYFLRPKDCCVDWHVAKYLATKKNTAACYVNPFKGVHILLGQVMVCVRSILVSGILESTKLMFLGRHNSDVPINMCTKSVVFVIWCHNRPVTVL